MPIEVLSRRSIGSLLRKNEQPAAMKTIIFPAVLELFVDALANFDLVIRSNGQVAVVE